MLGALRGAGADRGVEGRSLWSGLAEAGRAGAFGGDRSGAIGVSGGAAGSMGSTRVSSMGAAGGGAVGVGRGGVEGGGVGKVPRSHGRAWAPAIPTAADTKTTPRRVNRWVVRGIGWAMMGRGFRMGFDASRCREARREARRRRAKRPRACGARLRWGRSRRGRRRGATRCATRRRLWCERRRSA